PTLAEAAALAGALSRYANSINSSPSALKELASQVENALAASARMEAAWRVAGLYIIVDPQLTRGRDVVDVAKAALMGGATAIQLRDKIHDKGDQLPVARRLMAVCQEHSASFIINDHADLAAACGAHGLHVGQHDLPVAEARRVLYPTQFLGTSNALLQEAEMSAQQQADYLAVGAMYSTDSKGNTRPAGIQGLRQVRQRVSRIPIVAIGGITLDNVDPVLEAGADGICVIGAVCLADDPEQAARLLVERIQARRTARPGGIIHGSP
ncbi:MAG: thiamine phosphate synthase, partial [Dehalococcoidia bacterium]|nr:thiamine phosphate synthase [Dehalococcoidia bacterium]